MTATASESCAPFLKALGDETRWHIVKELLDQPLTVSELAKKLQVTNYNISKHVRILRNAGIVESKKEGKHVQCRIMDGFQHRLAKNKKQLDLGCCVFHFDKSRQ